MPRQYSTSIMDQTYLVECGFCDFEETVEGAKAANQAADNHREETDRFLRGRHNLLATTPIRSDGRREVGRSATRRYTRRDPVGVLARR